MSSKCVLELLLRVRLLVLLRRQERWALNPVHLHEFLARLGHGLVPPLLLLEISMKLLELIVLL